MSKSRSMNVKPEAIAVAGRILGIIATVLFTVAIVTGILLSIFGIVSALPQTLEDPSQIDFDIGSMRQDEGPVEKD